MSRATQRADRSAAHYASREQRARTPWDRTAVAFDEWRNRISELPAGLAEERAEEMTRTIKAEIARLKPTGR